MFNGRSKERGCGGKGVKRERQEKREREREGERERGRQRETERDRQKQTTDAGGGGGGRQTDRQTEKERERETDRHTDRERERYIQRQRDRDRQTHKETETHREKTHVLSLSIPEERVVPVERSVDMVLSVLLSVIEGITWLVVSTSGGRVPVKDQPSSKSSRSGTKKCGEHTQKSQVNKNIQQYSNKICLIPY